MASRTPGKPAITQRQRLGRKLRTLRELAGLTNRDLATALKKSSATISRMEAGESTPDLSEIDRWVRVTGASASAREELAALLEAALSPEATPWQSRVQAGRDQAQHEIEQLEASAATILYYDHAVVSGPLQVREYARLVFEMADVGTRDIPNKVEGRLRRQNALFDQSKRWWLLMTEAALYWQPGSVALQLEQLERIAAVMQLPNVQIGLLPLRGQARAIYPEGFQVYADRADDADTLVKVELVPDEITISNPDEVEIYVREFDRLRRSSIFGDAARDLLSGITEDVRSLG
jgi:transcriptional regulator with XRE-family HTH domain